MTPRDLRRPTLALAALGPSAGAASAHGLALLVATPVSPPEGYAWVQSVFLVAAVIALAVLSRADDRPWWRRLALAVVTVAVFQTGFVALGGVAADASTAPPPGLAPLAGPPLHGQGLATLAGGPFLQWNAAGLALLATVTAALLRERMGWRRGLALAALAFASVVAVQAMNALGLLVTGLLAFFVVAEARTRRAVRVLSALYVAAALPYVATGHLASGWPGGYVFDDCGERLDALDAAALRYARAHGGQLPRAASTEALLAEVRPHLRWDQGANRYSPEVLACPIGYLFHGDPRGLRWSPGEPDRRTLFSCTYADRGLHPPGHRAGPATLAFAVAAEPATAPASAPVERWLGVAP